MIERQRLLRARGYPVAVDGIWGPVSQRYWNLYQASLKRPTVPPVARPVNTAQQERQRQLKEQAAQRAQAARLQREAKEAMERQRKKLLELKIKQERERLVKEVDRQTAERMKEIRRRPPVGRDPGGGFFAPVDKQRAEQIKLQRMRREELEALKVEQRKQVSMARRARKRMPERLTIGELMALTVNPLSATFDPKRRQDVLIVQRWLRARGHKIAVDGQYGAETHEALKAAIEGQQKKEHQRALRAVTEEFYKPHVLSPSNPLPLYGGVPKPGELLRILQSGGFGADLVLRELYKRKQGIGAFGMEPSYLEWRRKFLLGQADELYGPFLTGPAGTPPSNLALQMYLPFGDTFRARSFEELARISWERESKERQRRAIEDDKRRAAGEEGFWSRALTGTVKVIDFPGSRVRRATMAASLIGTQALERVLPASVMDHGRPDPDSGPVSALLAEYRENPTWSIVEAWQRAENIEHATRESDPWRQLAIDIIMDPLNIIPGRVYLAAGKAPFQVTARGAESLAKIGWGIRRLELQYGAGFGREVTTGLPAVFVAPNRWIRQTDEALARLGRGVKSEADLFFSSPTVAGRLYKSYAHATRLKSVAVEIAQRKARAATHRIVIGDARAGGQFAAGLPKKMLDEMDGTARELVTRLDKPLARFVNEAAKHGVSLTANNTDRVPSTAGYRLISFLKEEVRNLHVRDYAERMAADAMRAARAAGKEEGEAARAWARTYEDVLERGATTASGATDPAIEEAIGAVVRFQQDSIEHTVVPHLQRLIEQRFAVHFPKVEGQEAVRMFDEKGLWVAREGNVEEILNRMALRAFDPEDTVLLPNWAHGKVFSEAQARRMIDEEVGKRYDEFFGYAITRWRARGLDPAKPSPARDPKLRETPHEWASRKSDEARTKVEQAWRPVEKGWEDTRAFLEVPKLRARQLARLFPDEMYDLGGKGYFVIKGMSARTLRKHLGVENVEVRVVTSRSAARNPEHWDAAWGVYYDDVGRVELFVDPEWLGGAAGRFGFRQIDSPRVNREMSDAFAHELRHAWQHRTFTRRQWDEGTSRDIPYRERPVEIDARLFEEVFGPEIFTQLRATGDSARRLPNWAKPLAQVSAGEELLDPGVAIELRKLAGYIAGRHANSAMYPKRISDLAARAVKREGSFDDRIIHNAYKRHQKVVNEIYNQNLSHALLEEGAVWQALRHAQSAKYRAIYYGAVASVAPWRFVTLALRPGWMVRNVVDNTVKMMLQGVHNPAKWFVGGKRPGSIFDQDIRMLKYFARQMDSIFGTESSVYFQAALDEVLNVPASILSRVFSTHGLPVPEHLISMGRFAKGEQGTRLTLRTQAQKTKAEKARQWWDSFSDGAWEVMGNRPEMFNRRAQYRAVFQKAMKDGYDEADAAIMAWKRVEKTLFDYSKISVFEDNLRPFFPFIQFWRKNTVYWSKTFAEKPWFVAGIAEYVEGRNVILEDQPRWMRRYVHAKEVADVLSRVPGLGSWLGPHLADSNVMYDPLGYISFAPMWRAFKGANPLLSEEDAGVRFLGDIIDSFNDWGLGLNPFLRKPLEWAGILHTRHWQTIFPQTGLAEAMSRHFLHERFPNGLNIEAMLADPILRQIGVRTIEEARADSFENYVRMEIANQRLRGEPINRQKAEEKIRDFFYVQAVVGYFSGVYARRMTPEDFYLAQLADGFRRGVEDYRKLPEDVQRAYDLWKRRNPQKFNELEYSAYLEAAPLVRAYYQLPFAEAQEFKKEHPQILPFVSSAWKGGRLGSNFISSQALVMDTQAAMQMFELVRTAGIDHETRRLAEALLVTPELRAFWNKNKTPRQMRDQMLRAAYHRHLMELNKLYWSLPEDDWQARREFLAEHPHLRHWWMLNNKPSDDLRALDQAIRQPLRDRYFEILGPPGKTNWDGAANFLRRYPFLFEGTSLEGRHEPDGSWTPRTQRGRDYRRAKPHLDIYFSLPKGQRSAWLRGGSESARIVREYFEKYGTRRATFGRGGQRRGRSQRAQDYLRARPHLNHYFSLPPGQRSAWLRGGSEGARIVRAYFDKYARRRPGGSRGPRQLSQKARDYLNARPHLRAYFALPAEQRRDWLAKNHGPARIVKAYFAKYAKRNQTERARAYEKARPHLSHYFGLVEAGNREAAAEWLRGNSEGARIVRDYFDRFANRGGQSQHAKDYLTAKPALDVYFRLQEKSSSEARAWLSGGSAEAEIVRAYFKQYGRLNQLARNWKEWVGAENPEINLRLKFWQQYFALEPHKRPAFAIRHAEEHGIFVWGPLGRQERQDSEQDFLRRSIAHGKGALTEQDALYLRVAPLIEVYQALDDPGERNLFLRANPELSDYFKRFSGSLTGDPKLDELIKGYFNLPTSSALRSQYLRSHPEVQDYFNERSTPAERAIRSLLEVYFELPHGHERQHFLARHPEVANYFSQRRFERENRRRHAEVFDRIDPRLAPFHEQARIIKHQGDWMRRRLRAKRPPALERRRERREE